MRVAASVRRPSSTASMNSGVSQTSSRRSDRIDGTLKVGVAAMPRSLASQGSKGTCLRQVLMWRTIKRSGQRAWDRQQICGDNTESWRQFFSIRSLWWFHLRNRAKYNSREARLAELLPSDTPVIRLTTPAELNRFYETQGLARP